MKTVEYLAFGAGPPSLALGILNAWGHVRPKAELAVFADTGGEKQRTYELLSVYEDWFAEMGMDLVTVRSKDGPLHDYLETHSLAFPVHTTNGIGKRQCTDKWKIAPVEKYLHERYGRETALIAQLGMHSGEAHRLRDPRVKRNRNRWPLVEMGIDRQGCIDIIKEARLPVPPWSSCYFCPLQPDGRWRRLAAEHPKDFAKAVSIDRMLADKAERQGKERTYLHYNKRPLEVLYSAGQLAMPLADDGERGYCEAFNCET